MNYIRWFNEIGLSESALVGGKGANLGELTQSGLPVPPGFCITSAAYQDFLISTGLHRSIETLLATIDSADRVDVVDKTAQIRGLIYAQPLPPAIVDEVVGCYHQLQESGIVQPQEDVPLAVRSSATAEDQANASFAGQLDTYLNIRGIPALLEHIKRCWASLWTERVVAYIANQGLDHLSVSMAVVVQSMISSEVSGVLFTANPVTGGKDEVVINASWGLGEAIVSGLVTPDTIQARKSDGQVIQRQTGVKDLRLAYAPGGGTEELPVREDLRSSPALSDRQVKELVALGNRIEAYYGKPQDIEWAYYQGQWYLLQSRPITTLGSQSASGSTYRETSTVRCSLRYSQTRSLRFSCPSLSHYSKVCSISRSYPWDFNGPKTSRRSANSITNPILIATILQPLSNRFRQRYVSRLSHK